MKFRKECPELYVNGDEFYKFDIIPKKYAEILLYVRASMWRAEMQTVHNLFFLACKTDTEIRLNMGGRGVRNAVELRRCRKNLERNGSLKISEVCCMGKKGWSHPRSEVSPWDGQELWFLCFMQERIQEQAIVK